MDIVRFKMQGALALLAVLATGVAGCRGEPMVSSPESSLPSTAASTIATTTATIPKTTVPTYPSATAPPLASWDYEGPSPLPPPEGVSCIEGRMLWPIRRETGASEFGEAKYKYGFLNERGELAIPVETIRYQYDTDSEGRARYLITVREDDATLYTAVYTMDGKKWLDVPAEGADIVDDTGLVVVKLNQGLFDGVLSPDSRVMLLELQTGRRLLNEEYLHITVFDRNTIVAVAPGYQEYLIDLCKGEAGRIPLAGYASQYSGRSDYGVYEDEALLPASAMLPIWFEGASYKDSDEQRFGYLGSDGQWAIPPEYMEATEFIGEYAGVKTGREQYRFIDRQGRFANEEVYTSIYVENLYTGAADASFRVSAADGKSFRLDRNLKEIGEVPVEGWYEGHYYREGKRIEGMPAKYGRIPYYRWPFMIGATTFADTSYLLNIETGEGHVLPHAYRQVYKAGNLFVGFSEEEDIDVFDANGILQKDTVFDRYPSAAKWLGWLDDLTRGTYLWVTTAQYQGYVDLTGKWLYRESRFSSLAD